MASLSSIEQNFVRLANRHKKNKTKYNQGEFVAAFGVNVHVVSKIWDHMQCYIENQPAVKKMKPHHLLWGLYFLKQYATSVLMAQYWGCSDKTFRKWIWLVVERMAQSYHFHVRNKALFCRNSNHFSLTFFPFLRSYSIIG